jgi:hypothetical protein
MHGHGEEPEFHIVSQRISRDYVSAAVTQNRELAKCIGLCVESLLRLTILSPRA